MPVRFASDMGQRPALHSFISGMGERAAVEQLAGLRIGAPLRLRRIARPVRGCSVEILGPAGAPLGWLPREDEAALETLGLAPEEAELRVAALVPAFQRPRVQIQILLPDSVEEVAPAA
ncbi:hypothetical protein [Roseicella aquatilis]|uniref:HIRAN domain-containing protein n=1 Tax=Roseicella aquatilis TaxID=2527868 RepID=A0A4R4DZ77_9PROT|nr:hypothetical protein [Roseicella aquatilis]TCZ66683.1 hypothetical protein EXY23_00790 [Roseicella aquatilis]